MHDPFDRVNILSIRNCIFSVFKHDYHKRSFNKYERFSIRFHDCNWISSILIQWFSPSYNLNYMYCSLRSINDPLNESN